MKHHVHLSQDQRDSLQQLLGAGTSPAREQTHARILLKADESEGRAKWTDEQISQAFDVSLVTIWRVRRHFCTHGLTAALRRRPQPERPDKRKLDGVAEAHLIALVCGPKPAEQARWSLRLVAARLVQLGDVERVSYETVRQTLKKTTSNPG